MGARRLWKWCGGALVAMGGVALILQACSGGGSSSAATPSAAAGTQASAASVNRTLEVSGSMAVTPFDTPKSLVVPPGFGIRVWALLNKARFMALAPNGDLLVSVPEEGKVVLLRERSGDVPQQFDFATGMSKPHGIVFHTIGTTTWVYIAESNQVTRSVYQAGDTVSAARQTVVADLPDASTPELGGAYGHELKNIAVGPDNKLYVSIGSTCNACESDIGSTPLRAAIHQYNADGTGERLFAYGIRNAEGLDFLPGTNTLWVTVNERDDLGYPFHGDIDGDGTDDFGKVVPTYVNDHPADAFTFVRDGGNYGWPYCHPEPNATMSTLVMMPDAQLNADNVLNCATTDSPTKGYHAHSAPLGFSFLHSSNVPIAYRNGAVAALHGCWNCTTLDAGYKVSFIPVDSAGNAGAEMDLVTGFLTDPVARAYWGRPVDVIPDQKGGLFISDDYAGAIYQLYPLSQ